MGISCTHRFLAIYSGVLTVTFALTVIYGLHGGLEPSRVFAADTSNPQNASFDEITVRRIKLVEPGGTPRLVIAGKAEFPGAYFKGKEIKRSDRAGYAGMIFLDDEGTENGGLVFGGHRSNDGTTHSFGHLSFDGYESNQAISLGQSQQGDNLFTAYNINDNDPRALRTPEVWDALEKARQMADGPDKQKSLAAIAEKYDLHLTPRADLTRDGDKSVAFRLRDVDGKPRILLRVAANGTPTMQFLDASGKVMQHWPEASSEAGK